MLTSDPGTAVARDERAETLGWGAIAAAHLGHLARMRELLRGLEAIIEPSEAPARLRGLVALAQATAAVATGDECAARAALQAALDPTHVNPGTSWRAVLWQPGTAAALDADLAAALQGIVIGPRADERSSTRQPASARCVPASPPSRCRCSTMSVGSSVHSPFRSASSSPPARSPSATTGHTQSSSTTSRRARPPRATRSSVLPRRPVERQRAARDLLAVLPIPPDEPVARRGARLRKVAPR